MFRFVFALSPGDAWSPTLTADGFVGVETAPDVAAAAGVDRIGQRLATADRAAGASEAYIAVPTPKTPANVAGRALAALAETMTGQLLVENGGVYQSAHDLWTLADAANHPQIKIALSADTARQAGQVPGVLVPTLNLKIGLLRVRQNHADLVDYARRLAGIGFEGWIVIDPPTGDDRIANAQAIAAVFRGIFPTKPAKKAPPAKAIA